MTLRKAAWTAVLIPLLGGCSLFKRVAPPAAGFKLIPPEECPAFADLKNREALIDAARQSLEYLKKLPQQKLYAIADRQVSARQLAASVEEFIKISSETTDAAEFQNKLLEKFDVFRSLGSDGKGEVVFSSYYEPIFSASKEKTGQYAYPLYKRPADLIDVNLEDFNPEKYKSESVFGRLEKNKLVPYFPRAKIDIGKLLEGRGLEIAWLKSRFDAMDLHVEGSARLQFTDGTAMRARFAGTNGLVFRGPMTTLVNAGLIPKEEFSRDRAKKYLETHPEIEPLIMSTNARYTFFELAPLDKPEEGPVGSFGRPLVAGRSIAVDPKFVPLGSIAFMETPMPQLNDAGELLGFAPEAKFVMCQDTGGAIRGPGRVDYFAGTGEKALDIASRLWNKGSLYLLVLKFPGK